MYQVDQDEDYTDADESLARQGTKQAYSGRRFWCSYILFIII